jgi:hypothetical protein
LELKQDPHASLLLSVSISLRADVAKVSEIKVAAGNHFDKRATTRYECLMMAFHDSRGVHEMGKEKAG